MNDLITQTEAAELRRVSLRSINNLIRRGRLRSVEQFGKTLVYRSEVLAYEPSPGGRPSKSVTAAPPTTKSEVRRADKTARKLNEAFRKATEDEQKAGKKKGGKR